MNTSPCTISAQTTGNNGNVFQILNNVDPTRSAAFTYDSLNRISQANTINTSSTKCWGEVYTIDTWGNLTNRGPASGMSGSCQTEGLSATATTQNQLGGVGLQYDAAGNITTDNLGNTYTYDAENRISTVEGYTYYYDADGARMEKTTGSSGTMYWMGPGGETLTEASIAGTINEEYVYFNGERIARVDRPSGAVNYYFSNHLGSASVIATVSGGTVTVTEQTDYYPFGGIAYSSGSDPNHYKFTGKERDTESGLDNFGARYFASTMGRFMTPDWAARPTAIPYAVFGDPQSLNLYTYVRDDPVSRADADGHCGAGDVGAVATVCNPDGPAQTDQKNTEKADQTAAKNTSSQTSAVAASAAVGCLAGGCQTASAATATTATATTTTTTAVVTDVLSVVALPLIILDYLVSPNSGPVAIDSTDQLPSQGAPPSTSQQGAVDNSPMAAHKTGERESTRQGHEEGEARGARDRGGEKGDKAGTYPRKPPRGWKTGERGNKSGKWPPTNPRDQRVADQLMGR